MMKVFRPRVGLMVIALVLASGWSAGGASEKPRLVLQITVDALRGDLPQRYAHLFGDGDDREYETDFPGFGRTFPHPYGEADDPYFTTRLTLSLAGAANRQTADFRTTQTPSTSWRDQT